MSMDGPMITSNRMQRPEEITVSCHQSEIPPFAEAELERLYGHIYSSLAFFKLFKPVDNVNTYVARKGGNAIAVLLFRCEKGKAEVLNEMIDLGEEEIRRFASHVFSMFRSVSVILFPTIRTAARTLPFPCQQYNEKEEFSIVLPGTPDEYTACLGKATRSNIKRYSKRLMQSFPSFTHRVFENEDIEERHIHDIIRLSKARMADKKKKFSVDDDMMKGLIRLAKACGFVNVVLIDGRVCAGSISYRIGSNYFAFVNAHDSEYDDYWLGTLCYYLTICESIVRGGKQLHMGWGRYDYKTRLLGVQQDFDRLVIYRSYPQLALNCGSVAKTALNGHVRRLKLWLLDPQRQNSLVSRFAVNLLYIARKLRDR
jgi:hypothetical protein